MKRFAQLFAELDQTTKSSLKVTALAEYFREAIPVDAAWAIYFLSGRKLKRLTSTRLLRELAIELADIESWLFEECYEAVGDLAETLSLVVPRCQCESDVDSLSTWVDTVLLTLKQRTEPEQKRQIELAWQRLTQPQRLVFNKLLTGSFRVGVSQKMVVRGLSKATGIDEDALAHRLMGTWEPNERFYLQLTAEDVSDTQLSRPYPFYLASPLIEGKSQSDEDDGEAEIRMDRLREVQADESNAFDEAAIATRLGDPTDWRAEWKWDGIRAQLVRRSGESFIWSRGEELITDRFPELLVAMDGLPDGTVIDGEILAYANGQIMPFTSLQRRIGLKTVGKKILSEVPVVFYAFDLLERDGEDIRRLPTSWRVNALEQTIRAVVGVSSDGFANRSSPSLFESTNEPKTTGGDRTNGENILRTGSLQLPGEIAFATWHELAEVRKQSRSYMAEGVMLKRNDASYRVGRVRGDWWKWKIEPYTVDAVLIHAQRGHGRRASLYTDYTFAVWDEGRLVPFAKAYSGLTDDEIRRVDHFVRRNTTQRFGPVRAVKPELVFELAFENIQHSKRHKSGFAVRFPRIARWRHDKSIEQADSLELIQDLLARSQSRDELA